MWRYKGVDIFPADNGMHAGIRWEARIADDRRFNENTPPRLVSDTKSGMRELITHYLAKAA